MKIFLLMYGTDMPYSWNDASFFQTLMSPEFAVCYKCIQVIRCLKRQGISMSNKCGIPDA
jgi:hypothetical protein